MSPSEFENSDSINNVQAQNREKPPAAGTLKVESKKLEQDVLKAIEGKITLEKIEAQARVEIEESDNHEPKEHWLLLCAALLMIFVLPLLHYLSGIILTIFTLIISLAAGFTSSKQKYSPLLNLGISVLGMLIFEYSGLFQFHAYGFTGLFFLYELIVTIFLVASYLSMATYRRKLLET